MIYLSRANRGLLPRIKETVDDYWGPSYDTYYDAYYQEMAYISVSDDLQGVDMTVKALVAVTATGSAIAGLSLWNDPAWKPVWIALAATAAMASIIVGAIDVSTRLKDYEGFFKLFSALRIDTDTFRKDLLIGMTPQDAQTRFADLRHRLSDTMAKTKPDVFFRRRMWRSVERELNLVLKNLGVTK